MTLFKDLYQKALNKVEATSSNNSSVRSSPPIPCASKPFSQQARGSSTAHQSASYWKPELAPGIPISQYFHQETGQHGWGNNEAQNYTTNPANAFFTDRGQLVVRAIARSAAATQEQRYTSARLITHQKLSRQSGYLLFRITAPCAVGVWPAVWLLPAQPSKWPEDGEIDVFEAWNGEPVNHSCLHWGNYDGKDWNKHRVSETYIPDLGVSQGKEYSLAWQQDSSGKSGRCIWYIDGTAVMKAKIPDSTKMMSDWQVIINVAMGGDVCQGKLPHEGTYDLVLHHMEMIEDPPRGWRGFDIDWKKTKEGHAM